MLEVLPGSTPLRGRPRGADLGTGTATSAPPWATVLISVPWRKRAEGCSEQQPSGDSGEEDSCLLSLPWFKPASPLVVTMPLFFCSSGALSEWQRALASREWNLKVTFSMPSQFSFLFKMYALYILGQRTGQRKWIRVVFPTQGLLTALSVRLLFLLKERRLLKLVISQF